MYLNNLKSVTTIAQLLLLLIIVGLVGALLMPGSRPASGISDTSGTVTATVRQDRGNPSAAQEQGYSVPVESAGDASAPERVAGLFGWHGVKPSLVKHTTTTAPAKGPELAQSISYIGRYFTTHSEHQFYIFKELTTNRIIDLRVGDERNGLKLVSVSKEGFLINYQGKPFRVANERVLTPDYIEANPPQIVKTTPPPLVRTTPPPVVVQEPDKNKSGDNIVRDRQFNQSGYTYQPKRGPSLGGLMGENNQDNGTGYRQQNSYNSRTTPPLQPQNTVSTIATVKPTTELEPTKEPIRPVTPKKAGDPVINGNFEDANGTQPAGWTTMSANASNSYWNLERENNAYEGKNHVTVMNLQPNMAGYKQTVSVSSNRVYRLSGYIRMLEDVSSPGASIWIPGANLDYPSVMGKKGSWQKVEIVGRTSYWQPFNCNLTIGLQLGKEGAPCTGKVGFDNIRMEPVDKYDQLRNLAIAEFYQPVSDANLIRNGSFEFVNELGQARDWKYESMENSTNADVRILGQVNSEWFQRQLKIDHGAPDYTRIYQKVELLSNAVYELGFELSYPKREGAEPDITICLNGQPLVEYHTNAFAGSVMTNSVKFKTAPIGSQFPVTVELRLGSPGNPVAGTVTFDDIVLSKSSGTADRTVTPGL